LGSPGGKTVVQSLEKKFKEWRRDTKTQAYQVLLPTPIVRELETTGPVYFKAGLKQPAGRN
jgi:hypothetical protein